MLAFRGREKLFRARYKLAVLTRALKTGVTSSLLVITTHSVNVTMALNKMDLRSFCKVNGQADRKSQVTLLLLFHLPMACPHSIALAHSSATPVHPLMLCSMGPQHSPQLSHIAVIHQSACEGLFLLNDRRVVLGL